MLSHTNVQPMIPVSDLGEAERFYRERLGLEPIGDPSEEAVVFRTGQTTLCVYRSEFAGTNKGTAALWEVSDVEGTVQELKSKGVKFEHYDDLPDLTREGDVYHADNFAVAWFKDPSGNILSIQTSPDHM